MNAPRTRIAADPLSTLLPGRSDQEMALRRRIFTARELAGARTVALQSVAARDLNHMLSDAANAWVYAPASVSMLEDRVGFLLRLAMLANHAERLEQPA